MSTQQDMTAACESALDYLYGMLSGPQKTAFEAHLATCARCHAELESFGRVRTVAKSVLPAVEPTERLSGALHAQLMHAATQQAQQNKSRGGKVLPFIRRFVSHPGYAAAAGILLVGGVVGWQMTHGNLMMPAKQAEAPAVTAAAPAPEDSVAQPVTTPTTVAAADPASAPAADKAGGAAATAEPMPVVPAEKEATGAKGGLNGLAQTEASKQERAVAKDELDGYAAPAKKVAPAKPQRSEYDGEPTSGEGVGSGRSNAGPRATSTFDRAPIALDDERKAPSTPAAEPGRAAKRDDAPLSRSAPLGGKSANGTGGSYPSSNAPAPSGALAPAPEPAPPPAQSESKPKATKSRADQSASTSAPAIVPAPKASADTKQFEERREQNQAGDSDGANQDRAYAKRADVGAQSRNGADVVDVVDADRTRANALAQAGRCDEATVVFQSLERKSPTRLTPQDRLTYTRCLRTLGRLDPAQGELNQLRAQKNALPATALEAEQQAIDLDRSRNVQTNKRAKSKRSAGAAESIDATAKPADNAAKH